MPDHRTEFPPMPAPHWSRRRPVVRLSFAGGNAVPSASEPSRPRDFTRRLGHGIGSAPMTWTGHRSSESQPLGAVNQLATLRHLTPGERELYRVNMARLRHPKKDVEDALAAAERAGWTVVPTRSGHRWGVMRCGEASRSGCQVSVWSTPRSPGLHARQLRRALHRCPHMRKQEGPE